MNEPDPRDRPGREHTDALPPCIRTLVHPGPVDPRRIDSLTRVGARHFRLRLEPGASVQDAIIRPLQALGMRSASLTILGGRLDRLLYCVAPPDASGERVANYTRPIDAGAVGLIFGNATLGVSPSGQAVVHCHASFVGADGRVRGGHVVVDRSLVGAQQSPSALVTTLDGILLRIGHDAETNMPLMRPYPDAPVALLREADHAR